jgi:Zn-dependent protease with chaperone function
MTRAVVAALAVLAVAGCATGRGGDGSSSSWQSAIPFSGGKATKATLLSELKAAPYQPSSLAVGEEKDLARCRGEGLGFVRVPSVEAYLGQIRSALVRASGVTGVPGRVTILADRSLAAYSTADGNIFVSMTWLQDVKSGDELGAVVAHELAHVLLKHHTADVVAATQHKAQALHELVVSARTTYALPTGAKSQTGTVTKEQVAADVTDKLALPAWDRRQEREADLLGVDLLARAGFDPGAMVTMLEHLQAWERQHQKAEEAFWKGLPEKAQRSPGEALADVYGRVTEAVATQHPKTEERLEDIATYLDRHYAELKPVDAPVASWAGVKKDAASSEILRNYESAFFALAKLEQGETREAYAKATTATSGRTATDAYPNFVLARAAARLGRAQEAAAVLLRALKSPEPVPVIYEELITTYERAGAIDTALALTDRASVTFGQSPRWTPTKIRLLREAGRTADASALTLKCSVDTPDWRRQCQEANTTAARR